MSRFWKQIELRSTDVTHKQWGELEEVQPCGSAEGLLLVRAWGSLHSTIKQKGKFHGRVSIRLDCMRMVSRFWFLPMVSPDAFFLYQFVSMGLG